MLREPTPCDIVAFAAHPDDVEMTCGGTLALAARRGWKAGAFDFTRGELATLGTPERREEEALAAGRILGLACRLNLGLPDGGLRDTDDVRRAVVRLLRILRPRVVIAPPTTDHHPDHMAVGEILSRSVYLAGVPRYAPGEPPWRPRVLLYHANLYNIRPTVVVDIAEVYDLRRRAIECYASQLRREDPSQPATRISHPAFLAALEGTCRHYGSLIGTEYGEGFFAMAPIPVSDLVGLYSIVPWRDPNGAAGEGGP